MDMPLNILVDKNFANVHVILLNNHLEVKIKTL